MPLTDGPGRPSKLSPNGVYELLQKEEEPMSAAQIGAHFDATANTARKRLDEVREYEFVHSKKVGGTEVFWYSASPKDSTASLPVGDDFHKYARIEVVHSRAEWLDCRQYAASRRGQLKDLDRSVELRKQVAELLMDYTGSVEFAAPPAYTSAIQGDAIDPDKIMTDSAWCGIGESEFCYYVSDVDLWDGAVDGLAELGEEAGKIAVKCESADSVEEKDNLLPSLEELLHAGDLFDEFAATMLEVNW